MTKTNLVPSQRTGSKTGATASVAAQSRHEAVVNFNSARQKLLDINRWREYCGNIGAEFTHIDSLGNEVKNKKPEIGDFIRIKLPAPENEAGDGYDWVRIEEFESSVNILKDEETFGFRVRPVRNPQDNSNETAHFYTSEATSTFLVIRNSSQIIAMERARNEHANTNVFSLLNKIRNLVIAFGAMMGFSNPQWKLLMKGILNNRNVPKN